jgi:hypothetical protein
MAEQMREAHEPDGLEFAFRAGGYGFHKIFLSERNQAHWLSVRTQEWRLRRRMGKQ